MGRVCYYCDVASVTLSYSLKLYPSVNKADTLAALAALFQRLHADATHQLAVAEQPRLPSTKGLGEFIGRAYRRADYDYSRSRKATLVLRSQAEKDLAWALKQLPGSRSEKRQRRLLKTIDKTAKMLALMRNREAVYGTPFKPPFLKAEVIDSAEIQQPRKARGFDCWIMVRGTTTSRGKNGGFYVPAKRHHAINRTLALPGAVLNESAEVYRRGNAWYARVSVAVPLPEEMPAGGWYGCDVGLRAAVTRSDGYQGPDLRPLNTRRRKRQHFHARQGLDRRCIHSPQRQRLAYEARRLVSVALATGRGISLEDPTRLPAYKQWAARFLARRVDLLAALAGVTVRFLPPAYSSRTCSRCHARDTFRARTYFRCRVCGYTHNADYNASVNLALGTYRDTAVSHGSLRLVPVPGGAEATE